MPDAHAVLQDLDGRPALRFERLLPHSQEWVWSALTEPDQQQAWHPTPARFEPAVGGRVDYLESGDVPGMDDGEVTDYEPPRLLAYTWAVGDRGTDHLRWELRPHDDGCLLVLVHSFDDRFKAARDGAGWHVCLDALGDALDGGPGRGTPTPAETEWQQLNGNYQERFGISPEEATPPPSRD